MPTSDSEEEEPERFHSYLGDVLARDPYALRRILGGNVPIRPYRGDALWHFGPDAMPFQANEVELKAELARRLMATHAGQHEYVEYCLCGFCFRAGCCPGPVSIVCSLTGGARIGRLLPEFPTGMQRWIGELCATHGYKFRTATTVTTFTRREDGVVESRTDATADKDIPPATSTGSSPDGG
jgi:hypothetical protein